MMNTDIRTLYKNYESPEFAEKYRDVELSGWVRTNRASKTFGFIELNDGTFFKSVQVVYEESFLENFAEVAKLIALSATA